MNKIAVIYEEYILLPTNEKKKYIACRCCDCNKHKKCSHQKREHPIIGGIIATCVCFCKNFVGEKQTKLI
nr:hypothetical protein [Methanobrevibacter arboriphilus]